MQYNTDISADYIAVADFNNDKKSDLLVSATPIGPLYQGSISIPWILARKNPPLLV